ncbi:hypothetical protein HanRHA438_Chr07g0297321 [Helianthus annuus]|nr:hypothetical protein HanRHA438_Chr07g0297321 [Helianthus annuus]
MFKITAPFDTPLLDNLHCLDFLSELWNLKMLQNKKKKKKKKKKFKHLTYS